MIEVITNSLNGTPDQTEVVKEYPTSTFDDKIKACFIERYNGNIEVKT